MVLAFKFLIFSSTSSLSPSSISSSLSFFPLLGNSDFLIGSSLFSVSFFFRIFRSTIFFGIFAVSNSEGYSERFIFLPLPTGISSQLNYAFGFSAKTSFASTLSLSVGNSSNYKFFPFPTGTSSQPNPVFSSFISYGVFALSCYCYYYYYY